MTTARALAALSLAPLLVVFAAGCGDSTPASPSPLAGPAMDADAANAAGPISGGAGAAFASLDEADNAGHPDAADEPTLKVHPPKPIRPVGDDVDTLQPTLVVENARGRFVDLPEDFNPSYRFELFDSTDRIVDEGLVAATDAGYAFPTGPDYLTQDTDYRWRARAEYDGAQGPWGEATFRTPVVRIAPPMPTDPEDGATNVQAPIVLQVTNGDPEGPVGDITMTFEIATDAAFNDIDEIPQRAGEHDLEGTGRTPGGGADRKTRTSVQASGLDGGTTYHWRVIARDDQGIESDYSAVFSFTTATGDVGGGGGGGSGGGSGVDEIDPSNVTWLHTDVGGWDETSKITNVRIHDVPAGGICIEHTKAASWPGTQTKGGENLAGNPWVFGKVGGRWYAATYEWLRPGQICKLTVAGGHKRPSEELGPHIKIPPLDNWVPRAGEQVGFMVSTPARFGPEGPIQERSNIRVVTWP